MHMGYSLYVKGLQQEVLNTVYIKFIMNIMCFYFVLLLLFLRQGLI